jgi:serine protease Do
VDWALYSEREQKVVYQLATAGLATSPRKVPDLPRKAVEAALENFIASPGFLEAVMPGSTARLAARAAATGAQEQAAARQALPRMDRPPQVAVLPPLRADAGSLKVRLGVDPVKIGLLPFDEIGIASQGTHCDNPQSLVAGDAFLKNYGNFIATAVQRSLRKHGYTLASQARTSAFDTEQAATPDFRIGGVLRELQVHVCHGFNTSEGWVRARVDWAVYSEQARRVVLQRSTEGLSFSKDKIPDLHARAFVVAFENLLADPALQETLKSPEFAVAALPAAPASAVPAAPAASAATGGAAVAGAGVPGAGDAGQRTLRLAGATAAPGGAQKNQTRLRAAVATLETAKGTGSGFYIDRQGYLLTNHHVVSGAKYVKVKLVNGDRLVAEVLRLSERDDVALLKSVPIDFEPLALRADVLEVGEEVFAIGTPLGVLDSTMTRGVLSADRVIQGVRVLQSDAAVTFGSSGGPLLDSDGRVIGITRGGMRGESGFNFFIPVLDALRVLDIAVAPR